MGQGAILLTRLDNCILDMTVRELPENTTRSRSYSDDTMTWNIGHCLSSRS
jgi:hypothetical protein